MAIPTTREEFVEKCLRSLGKPVIQINLDTDQIEDAVDDAMLFWREYHEDGTERTWFKHQITQTDIDNGYIQLPGNIQAVIKVIPVNAIGGVAASTTDNFFSFEYQFLATSVWDLVQFGNASGYFIANQFLAEMNMLFGPKPMSRFRHNQQRLYLDFNMGQAYRVGSYLVAEVQAYLDPTEFSMIWGNRWLKKLAAAYMKKTWGSNLRKFQNVQLPSGMVLNGESIYQSALDEIEELEAEIMRHQPPTGFIVA